MRGHCLSYGRHSWENYCVFFFLHKIHSRCQVAHTCKEIHTNMAISEANCSKAENDKHYLLKI